MKTTNKFIGMLFFLLLFVTTPLTVSVSQSAGQSQIQANQPVDQETLYLPIITRYSCPFNPANPAYTYYWSTCFNSLDEVQNYHLNTQGRYSLIPDPTGSGRGSILKCESAPDLAYFDPQYLPDGRTVVRSYPTMYIPQESGQHLTSLDVYVNDDFFPAIQSTSDGPYLSLLTDFADNGIHGTGWVLNGTVDLMKSDGGFYLVLGNTKTGDWEPIPGSPPFSFNQWHRIELLVTSQREAKLYQDGILVGLGILKDDPTYIATGGGHPGLYGLSGNGEHQPPFQTGTLYNDNWSITVWP